MIDTKRMLALFIGLGLLLSSCGALVKPDVVTFYVASHTEKCPSFLGTDECLLTRNSTTEAWSTQNTIDGYTGKLSAIQISGFTYEAGYTYNLTVKRTPHVTFDDSRYDLELMNINSKVKD